MFLTPTNKTMPAVVAACLVLGATSPALANVAHYDVRVDGLACPFCAYGLDKKLKGLPGATNVRIDLDAGRASFDVASGTVLMPPPVEQAVRDAGFTPRGISVRAMGSVQGDGDDLRLDVGGGQLLHLHGGAAFDRLRELVRSGHRDVEITGPVSRSADAWRLEVSSVRQHGGA